MEAEARQETLWSCRVGRCLIMLTNVLVMAIGMGLVSTCGGANDRDEKRAGDNGNYCTATATAVFEACQDEVESDYALASAVCINVSDNRERSRCVTNAAASRRDGDELCASQLTARREVCQLVGEDRYDPDFDPRQFEDDFTSLSNPNRYFPLGIGYRGEYRGGSEVVTVEVLNKAKLIEGVTCIVVRDRVTANGDLIEDTDDWFAQAKDGNVWYCGEEVKDYETFEGDDPKTPELVSIDGSFKAGRDGAKPGIIFRASPVPGEVYREEFSLGNAEDVTEVLATTYAFGADRELDRFVPRKLAQLLCAGDCIVTRNFSPIEPGIFARKYWAAGIGFFLEVNPSTGEVTQLVDCNFDPRCETLPRP